MGVSSDILGRFQGALVTSGILPPDSYYKFQALRLGVSYLGIFGDTGLALFRDPVTGSTFAVRDGESVKSGIRRVHQRFGVSVP
jgi:hypothetical protein